MKTIYKPLFAALSLVALSACMSVDSKVSQKPSRYWKAPADAAPQRTISFAQIKTDRIISENEILPVSDKMLAGEVLDLPDLVNIALENNTATRQYWFQAKVYAAQKGQIDSQYFPYVSGSMSVARVKTRQISTFAGAVGTFWDTGYGPSLKINWLLYDFGKRERQSDSGREALRAANFDFNQSLQDLVLNVNVAYFNLYSAMGILNAAKMNYEDAKTSYTAAKAKLDGGVGNRPDMLRALANLKNAEFSIEQANAAVEQNRASLAQVLGIEVNSYLRISEEYQVPAGADLEKQIDELIANALRERQNLLSAYAKLRKAEFDTAASINNYLPTLSGVGDFEWQDFANNNRYFNTPSNSYSVGLTLSWSLFEGFNKQYQVISAKAQERIAAQQLRQSEIDIIADVWSSFFSYKSAAKQVISAKAAVEASQEAYDAVRTSYQSGVSSLTDLLNSQNLLAQSRQQKVEAEAFLATSIARLAHSTGSLTSNVLPDIDAAQ